MTNNIPYLRNKIPTLLVVSAATLMLLLASPLVLSNPLLLQPAQAQTAMTFKTPKPADGTTGGTDTAATLTFDVHGTTTPGSTNLKVTNGTFQITSKENGKILQSGSISRGSLTDLSGGAKLSLQSIIGDPANPLVIDTRCITSATNGIFVHLVSGAPVGGFSGVVECSPQGGNTTTTNQQQSSSSSSMAAGSSQDNNSKDGDSDGIPDSSDRCTHNSNPRCFKEGEASSTTTTTNEQQPSTSSSGTGNQTR